MPGDETIDPRFVPLTEGSLRLDKWLWQARFIKTRGLAARMVSEGKVRVNAVRVSKPSRPVSPGDTLTFPQGDAIRVVRIRAVPVRRGPAPEARLCYEDLAPATVSRDAGSPRSGGARPTKKARRDMESGGSGGRS